MLKSSPWLSLLWVIACIVLITGAAYWFTRHMAGKGGLMPSLGKGRQMEILDQLPVGREQRLVLVRSGERYFLLGVTAGGISALAEFTAEEAALWQREEAEQTPPSFREALRVTLKNKRAEVRESCQRSRKD